MVFQGNAALIGLHGLGERHIAALERRHNPLQFGQGRFKC